MKVHEKQNGIDILWLLTCHICWKMKQNGPFVIKGRRPLSYIHQPRPVARFQELVGHNTFLGEQDFCFYYMFKTNFSGRNKIWGGHKRNLGGITPEYPPVATSLHQPTVVLSCGDKDFLILLQSCGDKRLCYPFRSTSFSELELSR